MELPDTEINEILNKLKRQTCDDCAAQGVEWTSIRKGTLICSECFVHHSYIGSERSFLRCLRLGSLDREQIPLIYSLNEANVNVIWEHRIMHKYVNAVKPEPNSPSDVKEKFIQHKYEDQAFKQKYNESDGDHDCLDSQLIACVRSNHANVTLKIIALGANVNYECPETGDTPMHVAAREGNSNQIELLYLYGANLKKKNNDGLTPHMVARAAGHETLAQRIFELFYYMPDRLTLMLCNRKPDHKNGQHFLIPEVTDRSLTATTEVLRNRLSVLSDKGLLDIIEDLFDEVCRRENEMCWNAVYKTTKYKPKRSFVLFLPPVSNMSATRNQRRQKLATLELRRFSTCVLHVLKELRRRERGERGEIKIAPKQNQQQAQSQNQHTQQLQNLQHDDHVYDEIEMVTTKRSSSGNRTDSIVMFDDSNASMVDEMLKLKERLTVAESKINVLKKENAALKSEISILQLSHMDTGSEIVGIREELKKLQRADMSRRINPISEGPSSQHGFSPRSSEFRIYDGDQYSNYRSSNNRHQELLEEESLERGPTGIIMEPSAYSRNTSSAGGVILKRIVEKCERVLKELRNLSDFNTSKNPETITEKALNISFYTNELIILLPNSVPHEKITSLLDSITMLNAKCNAPVVSVHDISEVCSIVAKSLHSVMLSCNNYDD